MKLKDKKALHTKEDQELRTMEQDLAMELVKRRNEKKAHKLANVSMVKTLADDLARVKTILRLRQLAQDAPVAATNQATTKPAAKKPAKKTPLKKTMARVSRKTGK